MAEYIDRTELAVTPIDITDLPTDKCIMVYLAEDVDSLPTADVIERSKINKAIEEITNIVGYEDGIDTMNVGDDLMISWCKTLEILKRI